MKISQPDLVKIVEKSSTLSERLSEEFIHDETGREENLIDARLKKWCQVSAKGDETKFSNRLIWDELDINKVRHALGSVRLKNQEYLPSWVDTLREVMELADFFAQQIFSQRNLQNFQYLDPEKPIAFEEVLLSFVEVAKQKLLKQIGSNYQLLSDSAHAQLERNLLERLVEIFSLPLDLEFSIFRASRGSHLTLLIQQLGGNSSKDQYIEFVQTLLSDGLLSFFKEYSTLARLAATAVNFWVETVGEFFYRLSADYDQIQQVFQPDKELGQVVDVELGLSDPHKRGRSVIIIKFASDLKIVYKPKNLGLEQAYFQFLTWLNEQEITLPLKTLKIVNCSNHGGWIEFVNTLPCEDQQAVSRYYQRAGMLLCIVYALRGTDCHCENLIACGEQPVLIDVETLLHHQAWTPKDDPDAQSKANERMLDSVVSTALLPGVYASVYQQTQGVVFDFGGLGNFGEDNSSVKAMKWGDINTDGMRLVQGEVELPLKKNQPFGEGIDTLLNHHVQDLVAGFEQMYKFFVERREDLLSPDSPLTAFSSQEVRLVLRNTSVYDAFLRNSLSCECLRYGVERSIELDILTRAFLTSDEKPPFWRMGASEKKAIEQLDIPYISAYSDSDTVTINSEDILENFLNKPSYEDVISRLQHFNDDDLATQVSIIQGSLYSDRLEEAPNVLTLDSSREVITSEAVCFSETAILQQAIAIGQELEKRAICGSNNSVAWVGMQYNSEAQRFQLRPLEYGLDNGYCGISVFLAALASVTGRDEYRDLALGALQTLRKTLQEQDITKKLKEAIVISGAKGLASVAYTFVRVSQFLGEAQLIEDAKRVTSWITVNEATVQQGLGILDGAAGNILSLLAVYKATQEPEILMKAVAWGEHLLDKLVTTDKGDRIWINSKGKPLTGFSHGIAGIAYALIQLYTATKNPVFLSVAEETISYEQSLIATNNWSERESIGIDSEMISALTSWCYGIPGIVLARLGSLSILDTEEIRQAIEIALPQIYQSGLQGFDNLACGNLSRVELLLVAAKHLSRPELLEIARQQTVLILDRAKQTGSFQLLPNLPAELYHPNFCQGTAGIGYELLRLLYPNKLPSILLWQ
ncbi:MAG: type 2 lantipeptide synthetase LanM family protein [Aetokthonos hydrillicola CCALA 1050]|nr:type 2 lantipeptide synthetase LanM [Aetokthonos hydrillicola CCALA 1050]MBW4588017.1 type 2 lantipeptide synthetase LanM family protein [Aetokthonos hydrillicola CCALA 1050]